MRTALFLVVLAVGCDDNKTSASAAASASASVAAIPTTPPSAMPLPPPAKKKQWKCDSTATAIDFEGDDALEKEVRLKLAKPNGIITEKELATGGPKGEGVRSLNLKKYGPTDELNPCLMPKFTQIHDLFTGKGDLEDLSPIANLTTMITLSVTDNRVKNLDPLKKLTHLDRLDISKTQVTDLTVVGLMQDLTELSIDDTSITDLSPLAKLTKLEKVTLANTPVKDLTPLHNSKNLKLVDISGTQITDTSPLQGKNLKIKN